MESPRLPSDSGLELELSAVEKATEGLLTEWELSAKENATEGLLGDEGVGGVECDMGDVGDIGVAGPPLRNMADGKSSNRPGGTRVFVPGLESTL